MTITDARKRIKKAIARLNEMQDSLEFEVEETDYSIGFTNHGKVNKGTSYGVYYHCSLFEEFKRKADAYVNAMSFAELLVSAASLKDPKAYHNFCERR